MDKNTFQTLLLGIVIGLIMGFAIGMLVGKGGAEQKTIMPAPSTQFDKNDELMKVIEQKKNLLAGDPQNLQALIDLGNIHFDIDRYPEAIEYYKKALKITPNNTNILSDLGVCYRRTKKPDLAAKYFKQVTEIEPKHVIAWYNMAVVYYHDMKDLKNAKFAIDKALEIDPFYSNGVQLKSKIEADLKR